MSPLLRRVLLIGMIVVPDGPAFGKIEEMLFDGATVEQLAKRAKTTKVSVYAHLNHLRKVLKLVETDEVASKRPEHRFMHHEFWQSSFCA